MKSFSLRGASVGARLAVLSCVLVALIFASFTWALTRSAGKQVSDRCLNASPKKIAPIAAMISLFDKALSAEVDRSTSLFAELPAAAPTTLDETQKIDVNERCHAHVQSRRQGTEHGLRYPRPVSRTQRRGRHDLARARATTSCA